MSGRQQNKSELPVPFALIFLSHSTKYSIKAAYYCCSEAKLAVFPSL
jgi:hypothetical protein